MHLNDGAVLTQTIPITGGCYYEFSFFGHGDGDTAGITATVDFTTDGGTVNGVIISVPLENVPNQAGVFGYYRALTGQAPEDATAAVITFNVTASGSNALDLDDVSFSVQ